MSNSQCLLVKPGLLGPESVVRPAPPLQQSQSLLLMLGFLGLQKHSASTESVCAECLSVKLDFLGPERVATKDHVLEPSEKALKGVTGNQLFVISATCLLVVLF